MKVLDVLLRSQVFMVPVAALYILLGGVLAAILQQTGFDPATYKLVGLAGLVIGIVSVVYSVAAEAREKKAREAADKEQLLKS